MPRVITCVVLAATLFCVQAFSQRSTPSGRAKDQIPFAENRGYSKGGIGGVDADLYIVVRSAKNELVLSEGRRWTGRDAPTAEVLVVFEGKAWSPPDLPAAFDLSKAVVVSFESDRIRFFDFRTMSGGYYLRLNES